MNGFVYIQSEPGLYTTGHYSPSGEWHADSDYEDKSMAVARCHELNGGAPASAAEAKSLRDEFAMAAPLMSEDWASFRRVEVTPEDDAEQELALMAQWAYAYANAMMAARKIGDSDAQ